MTEIKNSSLFIHPDDHKGRRNFTLNSSPLPQPGGKEVLLSIQCTGVSATDVNLWSWGQIGNITLERPAVLGQESCGKVVQVGSEVKKLKKDDRVAIESCTPCYACEFCLEGRYNLCLNLKTHGLPPFNGLYTRYFVHDANFCHKLPDNMSDEEGAMVEPLSVAIHACRRAQITAGDCVLICGAGPIGLLVLLVAKAMGAANVLITDIRQHRLDFAEKLKADHTLFVNNVDTDIRTAQRIYQTLKQKPSITIDCCGFEKSLRTSILATKSGGVVVVVGLCRGDAKLPVADATLREVDIRGVFRYPHCYQRAITLISSGIINVKPLITHRFKMNDIPRAFQLARDGSEGVIKIMIRNQE